MEMVYIFRNHSFLKVSYVLMMIPKSRIVPLLPVIYAIVVMNSTFYAPFIQINDYIIHLKHGF